MHTYHVASDLKYLTLNIQICVGIPVYLCTHIEVYRDIQKKSQFLKTILGRFIT